jgi:hypothetical protein
MTILSEAPAVDIDEAMKRFRHAGRELFNNFFRMNDPYKDHESWVLEDRFREIQVLLFQKLVLEPARVPGAEYGQLQPLIEVRIRLGDETTALVNRGVDSGYWDYPMEKISADAKLLFLSFFDWDVLDYRDNQYVRVLITDWPSQPGAIGKHALVEARSMQFYKAE